jgi:WD40 repeat protein
MGRTPEARTSPTLLGRLRRSPADQAAWAEFVDRYGPRIYAWCRHWGLQEADAQDVAQAVLHRLPPPANVRPFWFTARFSRDGRFFSVAHVDDAGRGHRVVVWDLRTGKPVLELADVHAESFCPDGILYAARMTDHTIRLYRLPEEGGAAKEVRAVRHEGEPPYGLHFDPSGQRFAAGRQKTLAVFDFETVKVLADFLPPANVETWAWSPDGRWLAVSCHDRRIYVYDAQQYRLQSVLEDSTGLSISLAFSPDGQWAAAAWRGVTSRARNGSAPPPTLCRWPLRRRSWPPRAPSTGTPWGWSTTA